MDELKISAVQTGGCALAAPRPYHHGDLRRGLVDAARQVLERDGPGALSLRAVAREAGVSPAAPYHHFKDKGQLLSALAEEGFRDLGSALRLAFQSDPEEKVSSIGLAYVRFARAHPAVYRVMYDSARNDAAMPGKSHENEEGGFLVVKAAMVRSGVDPKDEIGLELACIASWCAAHGLAEMVGFAQFKPIIAELGGEDAFITSVLEHLGSGRARPSG